mgnify:CR=1 FL=1
MSRQELMEAVEVKHRPTFLTNYLEAALNNGVIEMTQPKSPKSPTQKYRLTRAGKHLRKKYDRYRFSDN